MSDINHTQGQTYDGNDFWPGSVLEGLQKVSLRDREYYIYQDMPHSLYESLCRSRQRQPKQCCIVDDTGTAYSYEQFFDMVEEFAEVLNHLYHVVPGMHIGVLLYNSIEFCVSIYAINKLRAVAVLFSTKYRRPETSCLIARADLGGMIFHRDFEEWFQNNKSQMFLIGMEQGNIYTGSTGSPVAERKAGATSGIISEIIPEDNAVLMFTSGTTSRSKGVRMTNFNIMHAIAVYQKIFHITEKDRTVIPIPAYHVTGLIGLMGLFIHAGGCIWLHKYFDSGRVLREINNRHITFLHASPTVFSLLLERRQDAPQLSDIRMMVCGSSNMPKEKILELQEWMPQAEFRTVYGLTETSSPATIFPDHAADSVHIGSSGCPIPGMQFKICDDQGNLLPSHKTGMVMVRGTTVTVGYYQQDGGLTEDGWLDTGDLGYFDEEGYLYIVDRKKDMINRGGEKVCSFDIENALYGISGIREAAVVGIADERYGEIPVAMAVTEPGCDLSEEKIKMLLREQLAKFQIPVKIMFSRNLPMTANLKVDKRAIRELMKQNQNKEDMQ